MGLPKPRNKDEWIFLAKQRVINVLQRRIAANIRQLEVKISESGPPDKRPEPHILATALKTLMASDEVKQYKPKGESSKEESVFYTLTPFYPDVAKKRVDELLVPYRIYRMLADKEEYCSQVLENIASASFQAAGHYTSLGKLPSTAPLDGVYQMESHKIGNEVKNAREWVYPHSGRIWVMIRKCLEIEAVPFLLARKLPFVTRAIFSRIGILGFELHR